MSPHDPEPRYGVAELAALGGVSRRTVRYYVQEGLLPAPLGVGRGDHYGPEHLERLLAVKRLQEQGRTLDEIRDVVTPRARRNAGRADGGNTASSQAAVQARAGLHDLGPGLGAARTVWQRIAVAPGVELHIASAVPMPSSRQLQRLVDECHRVFGHAGQEREDSGA